MASTNLQQIESINTVSASKTTKRKIDDALHSLDEVLRTPEYTQPPAKKARFPASLYSTLARYGIRTSKVQPSKKADESKLIENLKSAPHLSAILSRAALKKRKGTPFDAQPPQPPPGDSPDRPGSTEYRPSSITSFLSRLSTFKLSTYANKPAAIDAVAASKAGWINEGKDRLLCGVCRSSWVVASRDGMTRDAANSLLEKQRNYLVQMHKDRCPWKIQQCDASIYCIPLKSPSVLAKGIKSAALELDLKNIMNGIEIRHPLTTAQVQGFMTALAPVRVTTQRGENGEVRTAESGPNTSENHSQREASGIPSLTSLFGWTLAPPTPHPDTRPTTPSITRANSVAPTSSVPGTPRRTTSFTFHAYNADTGTPGPSVPTASRLSSAVATSLQRRDSQTERESTLLHCVLCQRKVGLWAFKVAVPTNPPAVVPTGSDENVARSNTPSRPLARRISQIPKRQFDLLKEHRSYCPYVVRSTSVPSLPSFSKAPTPPMSPGRRPASTIVPSRSNSIASFNFSFTPRNAPTYPAPGTGDPSVVEGWRAVLTVILRNSASRRQRQRSMNMRSASRSLLSEDVSLQHTEPQFGDAGQSTDAMDVDGIQAMVEGVKAHGGKNLLQYVKSLFA